MTEEVQLIYRRGKVKKLIYLGQEIIFCIIFSHPFSLYVFVFGVLLFVWFFLSHCHMRGSVLICLYLLLWNNERLGKIVLKILKVNSFVFHAWLECPNISFFWSRRGWGQHASSLVIGTTRGRKSARGIP